MSVTCPDCGGEFANADIAPHKYMGGSSGCWATFNEIIAREFQDAGYYPAHRMTVDAYAAQHPGDATNRRAVQSVNIHMAALYLTIEKGNADTVPGMLKALAAHHKDKFKPLDKPGAFRMTAKDVVAAKDAADHCKRVREWAADVWRANAANQEWARYLAELVYPLDDVHHA